MPPDAELLNWYDRERRDLPWRRRDDAYGVWLSEIMLQQTQVETVIPYYERFLRRFPDLGHLAAATEEEVLATWSGLGYYRRARFLHRSARQVEAAGGEWPTTAAGWRALPGVGDYTAAALASILANEAVPVLDGNVERVVSRLLASRADPKKARPRRRLRDYAARLLDPKRPGDSNQALMELGATICRPLHPHCHRCPLAGGCRALASGEPEGFPPPRRQRATERVVRYLFLVYDRERLLMVRRGLEERQMAGFWEPPWLDDEAGSIEAALARKYGGRWQVGEARGRVRHAITHRRFEVEVYLARWADDENEAAVVAEGCGRGWFTLEEVGGLATSSLVRKALAASAAG